MLCAHKQGVELTSPESSIVTFVITIWVDPETAVENGAKSWRGEIRNVMQDKKTRTTFVKLEEISDYIRPYLKDCGVKF